MGLFFWLIILLAIAWGLADYQLQSRIEPPPSATLAKPVPAKPVPPIAEVPAVNPSDNPPATDPPDSAMPAEPARD